MREPLLPYWLDNPENRLRNPRNMEERRRPDMNSDDAGLGYPPPSHRRPLLRAPQYRPRVPRPWVPRVPVRNPLPPPRPPGLILASELHRNRFRFRDPGPQAFFPANFPGPPGLIRPEALSPSELPRRMPKSPRSPRSTPTSSKHTDSQVTDSAAGRVKVDSVPVPLITSRRKNPTPVQLNVPKVQRYTTFPIVNIAPKPHTGTSPTTPQTPQTPTSQPVLNLQASPSRVSTNRTSPSSTQTVTSHPSSQSQPQPPAMIPGQSQHATMIPGQSQPATMLTTQQQQQVANLLSQSQLATLSATNPPQIITQKSLVTSLISPVSMTTQTQVLSPTLFTQPVVHPPTSAGLRTVVPSFQGATFLAIPQSSDSSQPARFQLIRAPGQAAVRGAVPLVLNQTQQASIINLQNQTLLQNVQKQVLHNQVVQNQVLQNQVVGNVHQNQVQVQNVQNQVVQNPQPMLQGQFQAPIRIPLASTPPRIRHSPPELSPKLRPIALLPGAQTLTLGPQVASPLQPPALSPQRSPQISPGHQLPISPQTQLQPPKLSPHLPNLAPAVSLSAAIKPIRQPVFTPEKTEPKVKAKDVEKPKYETKEKVQEKQPAVAPKVEKEGTPVSESSRELEDTEPDFVWEEFLEDTGTIAAPPTAFRHIEYSLQSGFHKGMKLEVANKVRTETYWVATVIMTCGPLLRLRFDGYGEDSGGDFWCDVTTSELHAIGWCAKNGKRLQPPEAIKSRRDNWKEFLVSTLTGAITAPSYLLDKRSGATPIDQIKRGQRVEVQDVENPRCVWVAKILENVGGRLLMRYEGLDSAQHDFWLFYLNHRVHPMGWATDHSCTFKPPDNLRAEKVEYSHWAEVLRVAQRESENFKPPPDIFQDQDDPVPHAFKEGMKLEALSPSTRNYLCAATVVEVVDNIHFVVEIDDFHNSKGVDVKPAVRFFCHKNSHCLFPVNWASKRGLKVVPPRGWPRRDFDWDEYLDAENSMAAPLDCFNLLAPPHELKVGMKLEAVNPASAHQICAATITRILDRLLWIHLDNNKKLLTTHVEDIESQDLFPVGWCASNNYPLKPPHHAKIAKRVAVVQPERPTSASAEQYRCDAYTLMREGLGELCPRIYFNHRCFSGRYLNKSKIAALPRSVGPGPVILVMKEVLTMLINTAYKSSRVLSELQLQGDAHPKMHQQVLKAKYKGKSYRAVVEMCRSTEQIDDFCRQTCIRLECCPNLVSTTRYPADCPDDCANISKNSYHWGKKKKAKVGRPPGGHTNLEHGARRPGPKKKGRSRLQLLRRKQRPNGASDADNASNHGNDAQNDVTSNHGDHVTGAEGDHVGNGDEGLPDENKSTGTSASRESHESLRLNRKRTYRRHPLPPPSDIQTRGAKLPRFSLDRKTHQRIMLDDLDITAPEAHMADSDRCDDRDRLKLTTNPLHWSVDDVVEFIRGTDCNNMTRLFRQHDIDGQALLLLTLPAVQEHMELKFGPAIKLCHQIERIKLAFFKQFA